MGSLRFLIPTFPFLAIAGAWLLGRMAMLLGPAGRAAVAVVAVLQLLVAGFGSAQTLAQIGTSLSAAARARALAEKDIPAGSVIIVERNLAESLDAVGRWHLVDENLIGSPGRFGPPGGIGGPDGMAGPGGPGGRGGSMRPPGGPAGGPSDDDNSPNPQQAGKNQGQQERYAGLAPYERRARIWSDIVEWAAGKPVYWFARSLEQVENALPAGGDYESVAELDAPTMGMGPDGGGGRAGQGPGGGGPGARGGPGGRGMSGPNPGGRGPPPGGNFAGPPGGRGGNPLNAAPAKLRVVKLTLPKASPDAGR